MTKQDVELKNAQINEIQQLKNRIINYKPLPITIAQYVITIASINGIEIQEEQKKEIEQAFVEIGNENNQVRFWQLMKIAIEENFIKQFESLGENYHSTTSLNLIKTKKILSKSIAPFINCMTSIEIIKIQTYSISVLKFCDFIKINHQIPFQLFKYLKSFSLKQFDDYIKLIEYSCNCKIIEADTFKQKTTGRIFYNAIENLNPDKSFFTPLNEEIKKLKNEITKIEQNEKKELQRIQKEKAIKKNLQKEIEKFLKFHQNKFIHLQPNTLKIYQKYPELEDELLKKIVAHNEQILQELETQLQEIKKQWKDNYVNTFLDYHYNITLLSSDLEIVKKTKSIEQLTKILEILTKKEFDFLNVMHPLFIEIITKTNETILKSLRKDILNKTLPQIYLERFPQILYNPHFQNYQENAKLIKQENMNIEFFQNSDVLLTNPQEFQKILKLIQKYHCTQISFLNLNYFDQVDQIIENRFSLDETMEIPNIIDDDLNKQLNQISPIDIIDIEHKKEIQWLDANFKIDELRYLINGIIISRLKVLRYFKLLNTLYLNQSNNLESAIFYHLPIFTFEKEIIKECVNKSV